MLRVFCNAPGRVIQGKAGQEPALLGRLATPRPIPRAWYALLWLWRDSFARQMVHFHVLTLSNRNNIDQIAFD